MKSLKDLLPWTKKQNITPITLQSLELIKAQTQAVSLLAQSIAPLANFFKGTDIQQVMHAKAKADFIAHAIGAAINDLGLDARRIDTYSTELSELVEKVYAKIQQKQECQNKDPELQDAEASYKHWVNNK